MAKWSYDGETGPDSWAKNFLTGDQGKRQSPIDLITSSAKYDASLGPLTLNYEKCKPVSVFNSGHSFQVKFDESAPAILTGGPLKSDQYQLVQFHGHWGDNNQKHGSEHTVNGRSYPSELHFVHYNKKYGSIAEAVKYGDGLSVIGVFLKITDKRHAQLQQMLEKFKDIASNKNEAPVTLDVRPFIPTDLTRYFTYLGSLTTPPLCECIVWIVMADTVEVSDEQVKRFHELRDLHTGAAMDHNFRPVQPLNNRELKAAFADFANCEIAKNTPIAD